MQIAERLPVSVVVDAYPELFEHGDLRAVEAALRRQLTRVVPQTVPEGADDRPLPRLPTQPAIDEQTRAGVGPEIDVGFQARVLGHVASEVMIEVLHADARIEQR